MNDSGDITLLLKGIRDGQKDCGPKLIESVHGELRRLAAARMRSERPDHTLQPSALVNEAYLRLSAGKLDAPDRAHFFSMASIVMRNILVDHARARNAQRRNGGIRIDLEFAGAVPVSQPAGLLDLDQALTELATLNERHSQVVNLHFFGGLTFEEVAEALDISAKTAKRDWQSAKSWLQVRMKGLSGEP